MSERPGTAETPLRVAVVGSGPAGFYVVQHLFDEADLDVRVDMYERLPMPFGLVRFGVAPDHLKIKGVTRIYDRLAADPRFRLFANLEFGTDLDLDDLRAHYHQIVFCTGAQSDRRLGIPGESLDRSHAATEFVAWYNGHPDFADRRFDLSRERVVVVGMGNVAVDVARILCRTPEELRRSDIADHALSALGRSRVTEVHLLGRRGPAQAAFTNPELKELLRLEGAGVFARPDELQLDPASRAAVDRSGDRALLKRLELLAGLPAPIDSSTPGKKRLILRFLVSPEELLPGADGGVDQVRLGRNELIGGEDGSLRARSTGETERLAAGLVFRSVGYRGIPLPGLPFDEQRGIIPNNAGRVSDPESGRNGAGLYVSGWIKRGPSGVIGTNKPCAAETVVTMREDLAQGAFRNPESPGALEALFDRRGLRPLSYADWTTLDRLEQEGGVAEGRPRRKFVRREDCLRVLGR